MWRTTANDQPTSRFYAESVLANSPASSTRVCRAVQTQHASQKTSDMSSSIMIGMLLFVLVCLSSCAIDFSPRHYVFERGTTGTVCCPTMKDGGYSADETEAIYWSFLPKGSLNPPKSIISYFRGVTSYQTSNFEKYDIKNTSLVIYNVTYSAEGTYSYRYIRWRKAPKDGSVEVSEKVSCKARRPKVNLCEENQSSCEVQVPSDTKELTLTCYVEHAKPAVNVSWFGWFTNLNRWEEILAEPKLELASCDASEKDCFWVNDTFKSSATVKLSLECYISTFKCVANNSDLEDFNVTVIKTPCDLVTANPGGVTNSTRFNSVRPTTVSTGSETCYSFTFLWLVLSALLIAGIGILITNLTLRWYRSSKIVKTTQKHDAH